MSTRRGRPTWPHVLSWVAPDRRTGQWRPWLLIRSPEYDGRLQLRQAMRPHLDQVAVVPTSFEFSQSGVRMWMGHGFEELPAEREWLRLARLREHTYLLVGPSVGEINSRGDLLSYFDAHEGLLVWGWYPIRHPARGGGR